ncbi:hypothetical protein BGZ49_003666 [Haplosporangium sp. Z 27]|nr:hypothetical protein BGZ49_003666 [Haplosporangium sp. Z 27]
MSKRKSRNAVSDQGPPGINYFLAVDPPHLNPKDYVEYRRKEIPTVRDKELVEEWELWSRRLDKLPKWKDAFASTNALSLVHIQSWYNEGQISKSPALAITTRSSSKRSMVSSSYPLRNKENSSSKPNSTSSLPSPPPPPPPLPPPLSSHSSSAPQWPTIETSPLHSPSFSESSSPEAQSSSSTKSMSPASLSRMRAEFSNSYHGYRGSRWTLSSGTIVDEIFYEYTMPMKSESALHSFIILGEPDLEAFSEVDKLLIKGVINQSDLDNINISLTQWKKMELLHYQLNRHDVISLLNNGISNLPPFQETQDESTERDEFDAFRACAYSSLCDIYQVYQSQNFKIPQRNNESWFRNIFWGFLWKLFALDQKLTFQPGEKSSNASSRQRNMDRSDPTVPLAQGSKVDGIISCDVCQCELCIIEAGAVDSGPNGTKTLTDRIKLAKTLKDTFDSILRKCQRPEEAQRHLTTFGLLISGTRIEFATLRYLDGHFFRYQIESTMTFPGVWLDKRSTSNIVSLVSKLFIFKERMLQMSDNIITWSQHIDNSNIGSMHGGKDHSTENIINVRTAKIQQGKK